MKSTTKAKKIVEPEELDGPMMVWPRTPLNAEDQKAWDKWKAERKAAWLAKQTGNTSVAKKQ